MKFTVLGLIMFFIFTVHAKPEEKDYMYTEFSGLAGLIPDIGYCSLNGRHYPYNTKIAMNREMLKIYHAISKTVADQSLVVVMQCKYIVDPLMHDHPEQGQRKYIWVAGQ